MLKRTYDIVIDVVNGVTEKFIELIQASTGIRELAIKLTDGEDVFDVENKKIGVLATNATISSGAHKSQILKLLPDATVVESSGSLLVSIVEEGWTAKDDIVAKETLKRYLKPMIDGGVDTLILGCTHFPVLSDAINEVLDGKVTLINMGVSTACAIREYLKENDCLNNGESAAEHKFYASDKTASF